MAEPIAYTFHGLTFCTPCATEYTLMPFEELGFGRPESMDQAIVLVALANIMNGNPADDVPHPRFTLEPDMPAACEACGLPLAQVAA